MVRRLLSRLKSSSATQHPLGTRSKVRKLLAGLNESEPCESLKEVNHWLESLDGLRNESDGTTAYQALVALDEGSAPAIKQLLARFVSPDDPCYMSEVVRSVLHHHAVGRLMGYASYLHESIPCAQTSKKKNEVALAAVLGCRAWALSMKLKRFYYRRSAEGQWKLASEMTLKLIEHNLAHHAVAPGLGEPLRTPYQEYVRVLYSESVPSSNLVPQQMHMLDLFIDSCDTLNLALERREDSTHQIDIASDEGPKEIDEAENGNRNLRFFSTAALQDHVLDLAGKLEKMKSPPQWLADFPIQKGFAVSAFRILGRHWAPAPPSRASDRVETTYDLMVVMGKANAHRMTQISAQVRAHVTNNDSAQADQPLAPHESPFDMLYRLESEEPKVAIEVWRQTNASENGFAASVPALLPRYRVGTQVAFRFDDGLYWQAGLIRRISRDRDNRPTIGIEIIEPGRAN